jgi:hypothetical protein
MRDLTLWLIWRGVPGIVATANNPARACDSGHAVAAGPTYRPLKDPWAPPKHVTKARYELTAAVTAARLVNTE